MEGFQSCVLNKPEMIKLVILILFCVYFNPSYGKTYQETVFSIWNWIFVKLCKNELFDSDGIPKWGFQDALWLASDLVVAMWLAESAMELPLICKPLSAWES